MSFTKRIIDGARSGLNSVVDKIAADDTPLSHVDEDGFQRELAHRIAARKANPTQPQDNKRVNMAGASETSRKRRVNLAEKRAKKIHGIRERRARAAEREQEEAFRRAKAQAQRASASRGASSAGRSSGSSSRKRPGGGFPFKPKEDKIVEYYKVLDLEYGAPFDEVKKSYRKLMRKYHPDRHVGNPKKQKAATELTMRVTQAYNGLEEHLKDK